MSQSTRVTGRYQREDATREALASLAAVGPLARPLMHETVLAQAKAVPRSE